MSHNGPYTAIFRSLSCPLTGFIWALAAEPGIRQESWETAFQVRRCFPALHGQADTLNPKANAYPTCNRCKFLICGCPNLS